MRLVGWVLTIGLIAAVLLSETVRAFVLLIMLLVGLAGFIRFLFKTPLGWLMAGMLLIGVFGCKEDK